MSVVLYVFGAALLVWSAFLMLTGGMVATLDIAAGLAGSGVFALGLGAVVAALERLTRAVSTTAQLRALPGVVQAAAHHEEPPADAPRAPEPRPFTPPPSRPVVKAQKPRREPTLEKTPAARSPEVAPPVVVAPILGGGLSRTAWDEEPTAPAPERNEPPAEVLEPAGSDLAAAPEPEPQSAPIAEQAPEPVKKEARVPEWLARARARREAKTVEDGGASSSAPDLGAPVAPIAVAAAAVAVVDTAEAFEPSPEPHSFAEDVVDEPAPPAPEEAEPAAYDPSEVVVREGEHNGVMYRFFEDGSIEAQTDHGARRFASIEDLRTTILAARGRLDDELDGARDVDVTDPVANEDVSEPVEPAAAEAAETDPLPEPKIESEAGETPEAAAETPPAPEPEDPFEAALAALEGGPRDTARSLRGDRAT
ncbi:hypothetical protein JOD31_000842 [Methylopila capsulata]|uniref:Uncharacterized protein n=1 Tax=Methylopila capsulata TaxID=61654 RepID=A0A9W6ISY6_9HYPH|nr:hypothetical protein [Methylopila capsulata]MBM7850630.1 hypothetical protein [Methylopila capsulata]GLK55923.1 hypothetical protein GCM10008170_19420 [Methylopila capsulata]